MDDLGPATSEWVVGNGITEARYSATPDEAQRALLQQNDGFREHKPTEETVPVEYGACTQVLLRKARDGTYQLLLNGCVSNEGGDGFHVLPSFLYDQLIPENATKREVPAPVVVSVLVEDGACAPNGVTLHMRQRTSVAGIQINEGREPVTLEMNVPTTRPGNAESKAVAVVYPMAIGAAPSVVFKNRGFVRRQKLNAAKKIVEMQGALLSSALSGGKVPTNQVKTGLAALYDRLQEKLGPTFATKVAGGILTVGMIGAITAILFEFDIPKNLGVGSSIATNYAGDIAYYMYDLSRMKALEKKNDELTDAQKKLAEKRSVKDVTVAVYDFPSLLKRVAMDQFRVQLTMEELQQSNRGDEAAILSWMANCAKFTSTEVDEAVEDYRQSLSDWWDASRDALPEEMLTLGKEGVIQTMADTFQRELEALTDSQDSEKNVDEFDDSDLELDGMRSRGHVEFFLTLEVVDARSPGNRVHSTFRLRSEQAFGAGIVAMGYKEIRDNLLKTIPRLTRTMQMAAPNTNQQKRIIVGGKLPKTMKERFANFVVGRNQTEYAPSRSALQTLLTYLCVKVIGKLNRLIGSVKTAIPKKDDSGNRVARYLPHLVRLRTAGTAFAELDVTDEQVDIARAGEVSTAVNERLVDAVRASKAAMSVVRQAIAQYCEAEGVTRPRMRTQLLMGTIERNLTAGLADGVRPIDTNLAKRNPGILTRHVYVPRMPLVVVDAQACRQEEAQLREDLAIDWLGRMPGEPLATGIAEQFGLPTSHIGELLLGVVVDLAVDDALERAPEGIRASPKRGQLMQSALERAVARVRVAHRLATVVFKQQAPIARLDNDDALFVCFPEGNTLLKLLQESSVWRFWRVPYLPPVENVSKSIGRFGVHAAAATAAPIGVDALRQLLDAAGKLRAPASRGQEDAVSLGAMPFLASQTLFMNAHKALVPEAPNRAWAGLAVQVEHSYLAAERLHVMAEGLQLDATHVAELLIDCVRARPVLQHVPVGQNIAQVPHATHGPSLRLMDTDFSQPRAGLLQPNIPRDPAPRTLFDNRSHVELLQRRLAAMRFDIDDLANERASENDSRLLESFAQLRMVARGPETHPAQYLVPFGDARVKGRYPLMSRFFENLPVYLGLLASASPRPPQTMGTIAPREAHDTASNLHPLVITAQTTDGAGVIVGTVLVAVPYRNSSVDATLTAPKTLQQARSALAQSAAGRSAHVDAANAFLFNVERLVQCILLVAGHDDSCRSLDAPPPPESPPTLVDAPAVPKKPKLLLLAEMRVNAILVGSRAGDARALARKMKELPDTKTTDLVDKLVYSEELYDWLVESKNNLLTAQPHNTGDEYRSGAFWEDPSDSAKDNNALKSLYDLHREQETVEERQFKVRVEGHNSDWGWAVTENDRRKEYAKLARCWELNLWPRTVAVANAVARGVLSDPPTLYASDVDEQRQQISSCPDGPPHVLDDVVDAWLAKGLRAVPLCELAAVLVRVGLN